MCTLRIQDPWLLKGGGAIKLASGSIKIDSSKKAAAMKAAERRLDDTKPTPPE